MEYFDIPKKGGASYKAAMYGLAAASYAGLVKVTEIQPHDTSLTLAFYAFAVAIPFLITLALVTDITENTEYTRMSPTGFGIFMFLNAGPWAFVVGFSSFIWHYSKPVAITFLVLSLAGLVAFIVFQNDLIAANKSRSR
jgi:hypothetical protein